MHIPVTRNFNIGDIVGGLDGDTGIVRLIDGVQTQDSVFALGYTVDPADVEIIDGVRTIKKMKVREISLIYMPQNR